MLNTPRRSLVNALIPYISRPCNYSVTFVSIFGDEVRPERVAGDLHQPVTGNVHVYSMTLYGADHSFNVCQSMVSIRRIEKYLNGAEVAPVPPMEHQSQTIAFQSCTVTWPQDRSQSTATPSVTSAASTPRHKFMLVDMTLNFPQGELSLICGKLGSGKTLLLLGVCLAMSDSDGLVIDRAYSAAG